MCQGQQNVNKKVGNDDGGDDGDDDDGGDDDCDVVMMVMVRVMVMVVMVMMMVTVLTLIQQFGVYKKCNGYFYNNPKREVLYFTDETTDVPGQCPADPRGTCMKKVKVGGV